MDHLFTKDVDQAMEALRELEPEMREQYYKHTSYDEQEMEELSGYAYDYIRPVFNYMNYTYKEEKQTVCELMVNLYKTLVTGEYAWYESIGKINHVNQVFDDILSIEGYEKMSYTANLLYYYYQAREKRSDSSTDQYATQCVFRNFLRMPKYRTDKRDDRRKGDTGEKQKKNQNMNLKMKLDEASFMNNLKEHMDKYVVGQERLKKKLCVLLYNWKYQQVRSNLLMVGPSGSGKNHIIETIKSFPGLDMTLTTFDASQLTASGFSGDGIITCAMRHHSYEENLRMIRTAREYLGNGVCAADLAGAEAIYPMSEFMELFGQAKKLGMPFTIHAGECGNVQNILDSVEAGALRIGHGIAMRGNSEVQKMIREKGIGVEMCPISNLQTKAVESESQYPLREFLDNGIKVTINTDNRTVSNTTMTKELQFIQEHYRITDEEIRLMMRNAVDTAFIH